MAEAWIGLAAGLGGAAIGVLGTILGQSLAQSQSFRSLKHDAYSDFLTQANAASRILSEINSFNKYLARVEEGTEEAKKYLVNKISSRTPVLRIEMYDTLANLDRAIANMHLVATIEVLTQFTALQSAIWNIWQELEPLDILDSIYSKASTTARYELHFNLHDFTWKQRWLTKDKKAKFQKIVRSVELAAGSSPPRPVMDEASLAAPSVPIICD